MVAVVVEDLDPALDIPVLLVHAALLPAIEPIRDQIEFVKHVIVVDDENFLHFSFKVSSWDHHAVPAAFTFNANIHAQSNNFPPIDTTWMGFLHFNDIM